MTSLPVSYTHLAQCQLVETALLNILNYQILIATKAARIRSVIEDAPLLEFEMCIRDRRCSSSCCLVACFLV